VTGNGVTELIRQCCILDISEIEAFLALAEELHFGRTAERLGVSQPRVSRRIAALERRVGGALFERTTRQVRLTPLGKQLEDQLRPAYLQMRVAYADARRSAQKVTGQLRLGFTVSTAGPVLQRLVAAFETAHPGCQLTLHEVSWQDSFGCLRDGTVDVLFNWLVTDGADLSVSAAADRQDRILLVAAHHPLAAKRSVSVGDFAPFDCARMDPPIPRAIDEAFAPFASPAGGEMRRRVRARTMAEILAAIARGQIVHPTVSSITAHIQGRDDIVVVPISDLPPMPLGLIWCTTRENAHIRAIAATAASLVRQPASG
jgi:DNA-binding transcriptional LysR family regulator